MPNLKKYWCLLDLIEAISPLEKGKVNVSPIQHKHKKRFFYKVKRISIKLG